jgi:archaemetzincin
MSVRTGILLSRVATRLLVLTSLTLNLTSCSDRSSHSKEIRDTVALHSVDLEEKIAADTFFSGLFKPLPPTGEHDWLANYPEEGETFEQFLSSPGNSLDSLRSIIYILPMWNFMKGKSPSLELLRQYTESYFTIPVKLLTPVKPITGLFSPRMHHDYGNIQVHAGKILSYLLKRIPDDAYCIIGVTMMDLYPDPAWNFVFGYAAYQKPVGVFSFSRFDPSFYNKEDTTDHKLLLLRSCKVLTHEIGHMFGMAHCTAYLCNMNGSNNLQEADAQPLYLCPVCLRKLQHVTGFDILKRYHTLEKFYSQCGFTAESEWVKSMCGYLGRVE